MTAISLADITACYGAVQKAVSATDSVCGSTDAREYQNHMVHLSDLRNDLATVRNQVIAERQKWSSYERELRRMEENLADHRLRTASALKSLRDAAPYPQKA